MAELELQQRLISGFNRMPGCVGKRNISEGGSEGCSEFDISLYSFCWGIHIELKYRSSLPVRPNTPITAPGSLTVGQRTRLSQLWLKPMPTALLIFIGDPGPWILIPFPCIRASEEDPQSLFLPALQRSPVSTISPAHLIRAFDSTWAQIYTGPSPSLDWGPRSVVRAPDYLCQPRRATDAHDGASGGPVRGPRIRSGGP